jgi:type I restriction enzyme, S subunit
MIDALTRYPDTRETTLPWLPMIPVHWDLSRNGRLFGPRKETGFPDLPILEVTIRSGVRRRNFDTGGRKQQMADRAKYLRAARGDIAYNMMRMWQGAVGVAPTDGLVSPAYIVARPYPEADARYYAYLFRTVAYMHEVETYSRGIVPDRNRLYWESFKQMLSPVPPVEEQRLIVKFLDNHGALTRRLLRAQQQLIGLLEEQKQVIIHRAVTRGLDQNVRLKPSGVPWLGDVPEHWEIRRLKQIARLQSGESITALRIDEQGEFPVFGGNGLRGYTTRYTHDGDFVLIGRQGALCGNINYAAGRFWASEHAVVANPKAPFVTRWLGELLRVMDLNQYSISAAQPGLSVERIQPLPIPYPPFQEQQAIFSLVEVRLSDIERGLERVQQEIGLLREFRARLIADVVTGKLDVRAAAANLPEITEVEPIDDPTDGEDLEGTLDAAENEEVAA